MVSIEFDDMHAPVNEKIDRTIPISLGGSKESDQAILINNVASAHRIFLRNDFLLSANDREPLGVTPMFTSRGYT